jgi:hypothetical protein
MRSPTEDLFDGALAIPAPPEMAMPSQSQLGQAVLAKGGLESAQRWQRGTLRPVAGDPFHPGWQNDVFDFATSDYTGDLSTFDDGEETPPDEDDEVPCGKIQQPNGYPLLVAWFFARVLSATSLATNKWIYECVRVVPPLSGTPSPGQLYVADASLDSSCDPVDLDAYNANEFDNDGAGIEGPGIDIDAQTYIDCNMELKPLRQGVYPCARYKRNDGTYIHWIYGANDHAQAT